MKIKNRLLIGTTFLVFLSLSFMIYNYYEVTQISKLSEDISKNELKTLKNLYDIKSTYVPLENSSTEYLHGTNSAKQEYMEAKSKITLLLSEHDHLDQNYIDNHFSVRAEHVEVISSHKDSINELKNQFQNIFLNFDEIHSKYESGLSVIELENELEEKEIVEASLFELMDEIYEYDEEKTTEIQEKIVAASEKSQLITSIFYPVFLSSLVVYGLMISKYVSKPITHLRNNIKEAILSQDAEILSLEGDEEIKDLADSINEIRNSFKELDLLKDKEFQSIKNITDLKHALDSSAIVTITDTQGTIIYANEKFVRISKYPKKELLGQNHRILKSGYHTAEFYKKMWRDISSGFVWRGDIKNRAKDGSYYWVRTVIVPILDKNEKPYQHIAIRNEITDQKETEEKLHKAIEQVKKNDKLKEEFASMVTHELKTPLTPIRGYCEMLTMPNFMGSLNDDQLKSIKEIEANAKRLEVLIGDVLDAQKIDMNQMTFNKSEFSTDELMKSVSKNVSFMITKKNIDLVNNNQKYSLKSDKKRLEQVLYNLIANAVDFVPSEHGSIKIGTMKKNSDIIFYVKDNGIGIAKEKQPDLFKKFYQVDTSAKRHHGGTGLGLTICKGIVEGLGGKIWVRSDLGKGTAFYFSIPEGNGN